MMPSACASRFAGSMVSTTTVRPYSAARSAIAAAVVVLPTPPAPQHTTTRLDVSDRIDAMSRAGGVVLICTPWCAERFGQFVEAAEVDAVGDGGQLQPGHLELVELFCALGAGRDPRGVLDGLGQQSGKVAVGQRDSDALASSARTVSASMSPSAALASVVGLPDRRGCCG